MLVFSTKFSRARAVIIILLSAIVLCSVILIAGNSSAESNAFSTVVKTNDDRIKFLNSFGWEAEQTPLEEQSVIIPTEFSDVYAKYNELQKSQGFDLSKYSGCEVLRYTYRITNYPDSSDSVVADMLIYKNRIIGGDIQSTAMDGFMHGFKK